VAPGYYLYREQFRFEAAGAVLGAAGIPPGQVKYDKTFEKDVETYRGRLLITVPVEQASARFRLTVTSQGCADKGLCYPPMPSAAEVSLVGFGGDGAVRALKSIDATAALAATANGQTTDVSSATSINTASASDPSRIEAALRGGRFWTVIGVFLVAGVLLSLTPCVLPMLPILSSIIVGQGGATVSRGRGLALAASYSLGMALVYTGFGIAAGLAGEGLAATLQSPWVLGAFALGLAFLSLSMFGVYELQLPARYSGALSQASRGLPGGRLAGVFAMGGVSALIVSPCVAAPLAGALVYLSQTRDVVLGGAALFSLAAGMSVPLLLLGASAGALLPRAGAWMEDVKRVFGVLLLGVALWIVQPLLPAAVVLAAWGILALALAWLLVRPTAGVPRSTGLWWRRGTAGLLAMAGALQWVGAATGGVDPLQPVDHLVGARRQETLRFEPVSDPDELDAALQRAMQSGRPVMLDFYADWCVSCKEMDRFTFSDAAVRAKLAGALLLKADVTANDAGHRALLKRFALFGPPGTIFYDPRGREIPGTRVIGFQDKQAFLGTLSAAGL
jgi:thiol:disulfide interchange protein DsbD